MTCLTWSVVRDGVVAIKHAYLLHRIQECIKNPYGPVLPSEGGRLIYELNWLSMPVEVLKEVFSPKLLANAGVALSPAMLPTQRHNPAANAPRLASLLSPSSPASPNH